MFGPPEFAVPEFRQINEAAYWDYQRSKVYVRSSTRMRHLLKKLRREPNKTRIDKVIQVCEQRPARCFRCGSTLIHKTLKSYLICAFSVRGQGGASLGICTIDIDAARVTLVPRNTNDAPSMAAIYARTSYTL
jgi:hypothetical protein